jgi:protein involved in polysaccharide export with SLBB domain
MITNFKMLRVISAALLIGPAVRAEEVRDSTYILRPNDIIRLDVYEEPDLSGAVRILKTGHASFPLIG